MTHLSTHADQIAHYAAIKRRLYGKPKPRITLANTENIVEAEPKIKPPVQPYWTRYKTYFNEHVRVWRRATMKPVKQEQQPALPAYVIAETHFDDHVKTWRKAIAKQTPTQWLKERCVYMGVDYNHIIGPRRGVDITPIRFKLIHEMTEKFQMSLPAVGRHFGGRDHTTIIHALRRYKEMMNDR